jgi:methionine sulfoxide reductase heme-binding subunit
MANADTTMDRNPRQTAANDRPVRRTLGADRDLPHRLVVHHLPLAVASTAGLLVLIAQGQPHGGVSIAQLASPTGDVALVLLALTLLIGPTNLVLRRRNPTNNYLRRDVGTWTAIWSVIHVVVAFQGHTAGAFGFVRYFFVDGKPLTDNIGWGNWTGLAATITLVLLVVLSTDRYLRELKAKPWKGLQRLNYVLFALVVLHASFYGALQRVASPFTRILIATTIAVVGGQVLGIWLYRRNTRADQSAIKEPV